MYTRICETYRERKRKKTREKGGMIDGWKWNLGFGRCGGKVRTVNDGVGWLGFGFMVLDFYLVFFQRE